MKYAQVPTPIQIIDPITKQNGGSVSLEQYATTFWLNSPRWQTPLTNMASLIKLVEEFKKAPGEWMHFEDADYKILVPIVKDPDVNNNRPALPPPLVHLQLRSYEDLIINATDKLPV
jgi:hypothetical protein